jgi:hypothetical protein
MRGPARLAAAVAATMSVTGFGLIYLAWDGAASVDRTPEQLPYVLSGGLAGIGLIIVAMAVLAIQATRQMSAEHARQMAGVNATLAALVSTLSDEKAHVG